MRVDFLVQYPQNVADGKQKIRHFQRLSSGRRKKEKN
jgi:hypothetical protein